MFNKDSNLKNINIISKFISLLFVFLSIFITNNSYVFIFFSLVFLYYDKFNILTFSLIGLNIINYFYDISIIVKISFSIIYISGGMPSLQISSYLSNIYMGAGIISTFIISFIYTYIIVKIGYTLSDFE